MNAKLEHLSKAHQRPLVPQERQSLLSEKQRLASELYCASFFDSGFRSRFITLVTAVEALLDQLPRPKVVSDFVDASVANAPETANQTQCRPAMLSGCAQCPSGGF